MLTGIIPDNFGNAKVHVLLYKTKQICKYFKQISSYFDTNKLLSFLVAVYEGSCNVIAFLFPMIKIHSNSPCTGNNFKYSRIIPTLCLNADKSCLFNNLLPFNLGSLINGYFFSRLMRSFSSPD